MRAAARDAPAVERIVARPVDDLKRPMNGQEATGRPLNPLPSSPG